MSLCLSKNSFDWQKPQADFSPSFMYNRKKSNNSAETKITLFYNSPHVRVSRSRFLNAMSIYFSMAPLSKTCMFFFFLLGTLFECNQQPYFIRYYLKSCARGESLSIETRTQLENSGKMFSRNRGWSFELQTQKKIATYP